jgi:hypothetical protein
MSKISPRAFSGALLAAPAAMAFTGVGGKKTLILMNRPSVAQKVEVKWQGAAFRYLETAGQKQENSVERYAQSTSGSLNVLVAPGAIVTLTNVELGQVPEDLERA